MYITWLLSKQVNKWTQILGYLFFYMTRKCLKWNKKKNMILLQEIG